MKKKIKHVRFVGMCYARPSLADIINDIRLAKRTLKAEIKDYKRSWGENPRFIWKVTIERVR